MANEAWREPLPDKRPWPRFWRWLSATFEHLSIKIFNH